MTKKALLLTHTFPPYALPECYLAVKRFSNISNYEFDVVTMEGFLPWFRKDSDFYQYTRSFFKNIHIIKPYRWYKYLPFHKFKQLFAIPDSYLYLLNLYVKFLKDIDLAKYDTLFTWSMYHSIHLLGPYIKKRHPSVRWIAHMSDPWVDNPFFKLNKFSHFINSKMESLVVKSADKITVTSEITRDSLRKKYNKYSEKFCYIPHNFLDELYTNLEKKNKIFTMRYIGNFYGNRQPDSLFKALNTHPLKTLKNLRIEIVGNCSDSMLEQIKKYNLESVVFCYPSVDYLTSLKLMQESDLLLLIDAPSEKSPFLPSKLIDYIGANKPIFGITPEGTSKNLIEKMGFYSANPANISEISKKLFETIQNQKNSPTLIPESIRSLFTKESVATQMLKIIQN